MDNRATESCFERIDPEALVAGSEPARQAYALALKGWDVAARVSELRSRSGWSEAELARRMVLSPLLLARIGNGEFEGLDSLQLDHILNRCAMLSLEIPDRSDQPPTRESGRYSEGGAAGRDASVGSDAVVHRSGPRFR